MHSAQFTCPILLTSNASFSGIKAYRGIVSMNGPDVVYDIVARLRPFVLSRKLFEALAIRLHLHKSISSFHGASIDFPSSLCLSSPPTSVAVAIRSGKSRVYEKLCTKRSIWFDKYAFKITFFRWKGELCFFRDTWNDGKSEVTWLPFLFTRMENCNYYCSKFHCKIIYLFIIVLYFTRTRDFVWTLN